MKEGIKKTETYSLEVVCLNCGEQQYIRKLMGIPFKSASRLGYAFGYCGDGSNEVCRNCGCKTLRTT